MKYIFETVKCNLCGSDDNESVSNEGMFGLPTNVVICKNCGLGYLNPRWNHDSYLKFYQNEYDNYYRSNITKGVQEIKKERNHIEVRLKQFDLLPKNAQRILDIGSGAGKNLLHFKSLFPESEMFAIEPSVNAQIHLKKSGVTIVESDVDTSWDADYEDKFDIIIMRHVLEHFLDPIKIMKKVRRALAPSGIVYIAVPNNLNPTQHLKNTWFRNVHTYYFNKYSLQNSINLVQLESLQMVEGDDFNLGEVYVVARKSESQNPPDFSTANYKEQLAVFKEKLEKENRLWSRGIELTKKVKGKILSLIR